RLIVSPPSAGPPASATTALSTLSLHDALPISTSPTETYAGRTRRAPLFLLLTDEDAHFAPFSGEGAPRPGESRTDIMIRDQIARSEEHTSELQSRENLVCRLLLELQTRLPLWP